MNALDFHKMFVEQNNSNPGIIPPLKNLKNLQPPVSGFNPEFQVASIQDNQSTFPWRLLLFTCATIGLIIFLRNKSQNLNSRDIKQY